MMPSVLNLQPLAQLFAERIVNCAVEGMVIALLAWLVLRAVGPQNSGTRFAVWFAALLGIAALPLLGGWAGSSSELAKRSEITMPASWALYIFAVWLLMAAAGLFRVGLGFWQLHRLRKGCVPVDVSALDPVLQKTLAKFDSARTVNLCISDHLQVPTAVGFTRALVVLPSWTMTELTVAELNTILLHELAHLRRRDDWTNLIQKVLRALFFFHPAVWWIEKKLALEREMACDDLVLATTTSPRAYAECLVSLAEKSFLRRGFALAQAAVGRLRHVSLRVLQILDVNRPRTTRVWRPAPILVGSVSLICLVGLSQTPTRLVSFEANPAINAASVNPAAGADEARQMSQMGAHVVPANFQFQPHDRADSVRMKNQSQSAAHRKTRASAPVMARAEGRGKSESTVIPAKAKQRMKAPALIQAGMTENAVPQTLFLVMQTEVVQTTRRVDASGAVVWDLCVWQVTLVGPVQNKIDAGIAAKSI